MALEISTPALLFPAISLLLLAYTNRFLGLASIIRKLHDDHQASPDSKYVGQIENLRKRIFLIRDMQTLGVGSLLSCTLCMAVLFAEWQSAGTVFFAISLVLMVGSLGLSIVEIRMSVGALELHLHEMAKKGEEADPLGKGRVKPKRSWFRFSVPSLFWASLVVAVAMLGQQEKSKLQKKLGVYSYQTGSSWSSDQMLGPPNTIGFGDIPTAWASNMPDSGEEWVIVEFPNEVQAASVEIHETNSPGAVTKVFSVSATGSETLLWEGLDPLANTSVQGGSSIILFKQPTPTRRIKILIDSVRYIGWNEIDAVGLIDMVGNKQWASQAWSSSSFGTNRSAPSWYWP